MRIESSVTSLYWIPSEAISGMMRLPFDIGPVHYDDPPPDRIANIPELAGSGAVRFINDLRAWIEVENGSIVSHGHSGRGWIGRTKLGFGSRLLLFPAIPMPDIQPQPQPQGKAVRFTQTSGGRPPLPLPRKLNRGRTAFSRALCNSPLRVFMREMSRDSASGPPFSWRSRKRWRAAARRATQPSRLTR